MARWPRQVLPGVPMHLVHRGNNRATTFRDRTDFEFYRESLSEASTRAHCAIHAYSLMSNHVHLLLTPEDPNGPARLMQALGSRYVRFANARHARSGTLWEGRYRSSLVGSPRYLLACSRYIDLNPVRAGMTGAPEEYPWSSNRHLAFGVPDGLVTLHPVYRDLGANPQARQATYRALCRCALDADTVDQIRRNTNNGSALGPLRFLAQVAEVIQRPSSRQPHGGDRRSGTVRGQSRSQSRSLTP
jgi:putative transposase